MLIFDLPLPRKVALSTVPSRRISVVVRCRNEAQHLPKLIYGLEQQTTLVDEVVLVDSGSTDSSVDLAESAGWNVVKIRPEDFSFGRSLNYGCEAASGDLIVVLSAHVYPVRVDFIEKISAPFSGPEQFKITYGKQLGDDRSRFSEKVLMSQWFPSEKIIDQGHAFANNANSCFPRSLWEKLKFNEELSGLEDIDFSLRVIGLGGSVAYAHDAPVVHVHEETTASILHRYRREANAYKTMFPGEQMSFTKALGLWKKNILRDFQQAQQERVLWSEVTSILAFRSAQFAGAWRGFRDSLPHESELMGRIYNPPARSGSVENTDSSLNVDYFGASDVSG